MQGPGNPESAGAFDARPDVADASRRTRLASERTQLAWWRTGLTSIAVALGVGRVVPELSDTSTKWVGAFAVAPDRLLAGLTIVGIVLGALTAVLVIVD